MGLRSSPDHYSPLSIVFGFENGDEHTVRITKGEYWSRIESLFTIDDYIRYNVGEILLVGALDKCETDTVTGEVAVRMWEVCKLAGYVDSQHARHPQSMRMSDCTCSQATRN